MGWETLSDIGLITVETEIGGKTTAESFQAGDAFMAVGLGAGDVDFDVVPLLQIAGRLDGPTIGGVVEIFRPPMKSNRE